MIKLKYNFLRGIAVLGTILIGYYSYAMTWTSIPSVNSETPMTSSLWNNAMTNIMNNVNSLETSLNNFSVKAGTIANVVTVQTRGQAAYTAPISGYGTEVTPLNLVITPKKAGNKIILEWHVNGEMHYNTVYIVTRNGVLLANTTDTSGNRWAGVSAQPYNIDVASTPDNTIIKIIDNNTLATASTYALLVRSADGTAQTLYLNRTVGSAGQDTYETSLSNGTVTEIWQ